MHGPMWVFGYGSLIWNAGFPVAERAVARLHGWRRSFCMSSIHYRGTEAYPGLVLALDEDPGATCTGLALRVAEGAEEETLAHLRQRELISAAYLERHLALDLEDGRRLDALTYVIDPAHRQYRGGLSPEDQARVIAAAAGGKGPNCDYLYATASHLATLGIGDDALERLAARVREIRQHPQG